MYLFISQKTIDYVTNLTDVYRRETCIPIRSNKIRRITFEFYINSRSSIVSNTAAPIWEDEEWTVRNVPLTAKLFVVLFDKDEGRLIDDYVGQFEVGSLVNYHSPFGGHGIISKDGHHHGHFYLSVEAKESSDESKQLPKYTFDGPCRYFRTNSESIGRLTMINADCIYSTWKISMRRISVFFSPQDRQHWNREYKAARVIFGDGPLTVASRHSIKLAHKVLYGKTINNTESGRLNSADDLWKLIFPDKNAQKMKPSVYTYVIDDNTWKFSETGIQFFTDFASKHALMTNSSEYVRYAGEFHPRPKHGWDKWDDEWELVFDNGSGTYSPDEDLLVNLKKLLLFNFPGLNVVTYHYDDPRLKESIEQLRLKFNGSETIVSETNCMEPETRLEPACTTENQTGIEWV